MHHKDGQWIWVHKCGKVVEWLKDDRPFRMAGTHMGITQRKQHEVDLLEANEELTKSNVELEQFAYVASHDLQESLRVASSFTQLIERNYGGQFDDKVHEYMHFAVDGAQRMQQLIKDLLAYSRLGRASIESTEIDMEQVTARVVQSLQLSISDAGAKIISGARRPGPIATIVAESHRKRDQVPKRETSRNCHRCRTAKPRVNVFRT